MINLPTLPGSSVVSQWLGAEDEDTHSAGYFCPRRLSTHFALPFVRQWGPILLLQLSPSSAWCSQCCRTGTIFRAHTADCSCSQG